MDPLIVISVSTLVPVQNDHLVHSVSIACLNLRHYVSMVLGIKSSLIIIHRHLASL